MILSWFTPTRTHDCDDVYRTLITGQSILRSRDPEVLCNTSYVLYVVVYFRKNYKHGLSEIGLFNKGFVPLKSSFYSATLLQ